MKRINLSVLLLVISLFAAHSKNLKITVSDDNSQPLPYAHIKINSYSAAATDLSGITYIDMSNLKTGDTITASFIGKIPAIIVYDNKLEKIEICELTLREDALLIDEVIVTVRPDAKDLFYKVTHLLPPVNYDCIMNAGFNYSFFRYDHQKTYIAKGALQIPNKKTDIKHRDWHYSFYTQHATIISSSDTSVVRREEFIPPPGMHVFGENSMMDVGLHFAMHAGLSIFNRTLHSLATKDHNSWEFIYTGESDNMHVFTVSYPKTPGNPFYYQLQIFVDINTGEVCHINLSGIAWTEIKEIKNENYIDEIEISTDIRKHINIKPNKKPVLTTENFNCKLIYRNGSIINLELKDEIIKHNNL